MKYVFRNNTVENFFDEEYSFSGYDDISNIPADMDFYVWMYEMPIIVNNEVLVQTIDQYSAKLQYVAQQLDQSKPFMLFTMIKGWMLKSVSGDKSVDDALARYNQLLFELSRQREHTYIIDFNDFLSQYKEDDHVNWRFFMMAQIGINPCLVPDFKVWWKRQLDVIEGKRKKCLVLDLDNTLWGGVVGEDGVEGIKLSGDYPGKAFHLFQEALLQLQKQGVILTICSKNNLEDVKTVFEQNPYMLLHEEHFAAFKVNWQDKVTNIRELSSELNIGLDSMVFIDDNERERELICQQLPDVVVPDFPKQPYMLLAFIEKVVEDYFQIYKLTNEDKKKTEQYKIRAKRESEKHNFIDITEYIRSLHIELNIEQANKYNIPRIAQLTQKTNQFNLTTRRYEETDIEQFVNEGDYIYCLDVKDKFGDDGITGVIIVKCNDQVAVIDNVLLSCRVLGKNIEYAFVKSVLNRLKENGFTSVRAEYLPTNKNIQVAEFYDKIGFVKVFESTDCKKFEMNLSDFYADINDTGIWKIKF